MKTNLEAARRYCSLPPTKSRGRQATNPVGRHGETQALKPALKSSTTHCNCRWLRVSNGLPHRALSADLRVHEILEGTSQIMRFVIGAKWFQQHKSRQWLAQTRPVTGTRAPCTALAESEAENTLPLQGRRATQVLKSAPGISARLRGASRSVALHLRSHPCAYFVAGASVKRYGRFGRGVSAHIAVREALPMRRH